MLQHPPIADEPSLEPAYKESFSTAFKDNVYTAWKLWSKGANNPTLPAIVKIQKGRLPDNSLYILPGSHKLIDFENTLSLTALNTLVGARTVILGSFRKLLQELCKIHQFDLVFVDCGPSSGALNQMIFLSSDYIIPPVYADYFSTTSVFGLLTSVVDRWLTWYRMFVSEQAQDADDCASLFR